MTPPNQDIEVDVRQLITDICFENGGVTKPMVDKLEAALNAYYKSILLEVLGDEEIPHDQDELKHDKFTRNDFREDLRQRLESRLG